MRIKLKNKNKVISQENIASLRERCPHEGMQYDIAYHLGGGRRKAETECGSKELQNLFAAIVPDNSASRRDAGSSPPPHAADCKSPDRLVLVAPPSANRK